MKKLDRINGRHAVDGYLRRQHDMTIENVLHLKDKQQKHKIINNIFRVYSGYSMGRNGLSHRVDRLDRYPKYRSYRHISSAKILVRELNEVVDRRNSVFERTTRKLLVARNERMKARAKKKQLETEKQERFSVKRSKRDKRLEQLKLLKERNPLGLDR